MTETMALSGNCRTTNNPKDPAGTAAVQQNSFPEVVELNVGGQVYYTRHGTLVSCPGSLLGRLFKRDAACPAAATTTTNDLARDPKGRYFIDRDGFLFRYVLDYLRDKQVVLPDHFPERGRLRKEAEYFQLPELVKLLTAGGGGEADYSLKPSPDEPYFPGGSDHEDGSHEGDLLHRGLVPCPPPSLVPADRKSGFITVGYRGSCTMGGRETSQTSSDARFRRVPRILVCGRVALTKEVFGDTLNESRDPDRTPERYTNRFYLKFKHLERAFDMLSECGFHMAACNSSVTASFVNQHTEDKIWSSYTEYVFYRGPSRWSSPPCDCCCKNHKADGEGESGTSFNDLSTSSSESHSEASSPQGTVICGPVSRQVSVGGGGSHHHHHPHHPQTLDRPLKKGPGGGSATPMQSHHGGGRGGGGGGDHRRKSDLLRTLTASSRDTSTCKKRPAKEKLTAEEELDKCIQDFHKIKIPERFPERKYMWQADLLRKYRL